MAPNKKGRSMDYKDMGLSLALRPLSKVKAEPPRGAKFLNPFSSVYESDRVDDVPLKARRAICSLVEGTLH